MVTKRESTRGRWSVLRATAVGGVILLGGCGSDLSPIDDTVPPDTTITAGPTDSLPSAATFQFTSNEAGSSFECALDGAAFAPCSSPVTYPAPAAGSHTFYVRAVDPARNPDPVPAAWTWCVLQALALTMDASQNVGFDYGAGAGVWRDNRVRAYYDDAGTDIVTWIGFDTSSIPNGMRITEMTLRLRHEVGFSNPLGNPELVLWYSTGTGWDRASVVKANLPATQAVSGAYSTFADDAWNDFAVDLGARDFSADLVDDWLTLGIRNPLSTYSYVYFYGTDNAATRPQLSVAGEVCP